MRFSVPYAAGHTAGSSVGEAPRGLVRTTLTAGALLLLAVVVGLSLAAGAAQATTFPGTNGRIAASGALAPLGSPSRLELFTMDSSQNASATVPAPDQCRLTDNLDNSDFNPRYSKDGRKIVWVKDSNLWTMQLDQAGKCPAPSSDPTPLGKPGDPKQLTGSDADAVTGGKDSFVGGWCTKPNGEEWIVFQRNAGTGHSFEVYKVQIDANREPVADTEVALTDNPANDSQPSVTHDCDKIAFHSSRAVPGLSPAPPTGSSASNIWVMGFAGDTSLNPAQVLTSSLTRVNSPTTTEQPNKQYSEESAPAWSPDKTKIAFQGDLDTMPGQPRNLEIYKGDYSNGSPTADPPVPPSLSNIVRLSHSPHSASDNPHPLESQQTDVTGFDLNPQYSPDGTRICFHSGRAQEFRDSGSPTVKGQWELYTLDAVNGEGSTQTGTQRKTWREGNDERCGWQETP